jgi:hypothetical protein
MSTPTIPRSIANSSLSVTLPPIATLKTLPPLPALVSALKVPSTTLSM